jgi:hypothetical protein
MDIPINKAMLAWNKKTKRVKVIEHPSNGAFKKFDMDSDIGASWEYWEQAPLHEKLNEINNKIIDLIKDDFDISHILDELGVIPEYRNHFPIWYVKYQDTFS